MNLFLRLLLVLAALCALPAASTHAGEPASALFAVSANEEHTYFVGNLGAWVHNGCGDPITRLHPHGSLKPSIIEGIRKQSTEQIVNDLKRVGPNQLKLRPDGTVLDGNHRVKVLEERGFDTSTLWDGAEVIPKSTGFFWDD
jgi:hypothetical protein